jgi:hypothetical protein
VSCFEDSSQVEARTSEHKYVTYVCLSSKAHAAELLLLLLLLLLVLLLLRMLLSCNATGECFQL